MSRCEPTLPTRIVTLTVDYKKEAGDATVWVAFKLHLPAWMLCLRSGIEDGRLDPSISSSRHAAAFA